MAMRFFRRRLHTDASTSAAKGPSVYVRADVTLLCLFVLYFLIILFLTYFVSTVAGNQETNLKLTCLNNRELFHSVNPLCRSILNDNPPRNPAPTSTPTPNKTTRLSPSTQ